MMFPRRWVAPLAMITAALVAVACVAASIVIVRNLHADEARPTRADQARRISAAPAPTHSAATPSTTQPVHPLAGLKILLDPGHSGALVNATRQVSDGRGRFKDCNNSSTATVDGFPEHEFNWQVATRLKALLEAEGAVVTLTRSDDTSMGPCVDQRGQMSAGQDVALSIHANGTPDTRVKGYFALISSPPLNDAQGQPSVDLAHALLTALGNAGFSQSPASDNGITPRSDIAGLNFAQAPSVLMELGEMRNPEEAAIMKTPEGQDRYAHALFDGLSAWAQTRAQAQAPAQAQATPTASISHGPAPSPTR